MNPRSPEMPGRRPVTGMLVGLLLGAIFLVLSCLRVLGDARSAQFNGRVLNETLEQPLWGTALGAKLAYFFSAMLLSHLALGLIAWLLASVSPAAWPRSRNGTVAWTLLWFLLLAGWVLIANAAWYPSSLLGYPYAELVGRSVAGVGAFEIATLAVGAAVFLTLARWVLARGPALRPALLALGGTACLAVGVAVVAGPDAAVSAVDPNRPNVIVIGLDSLRTDHVGGDSGASLTPEIDGFLEGATVFSDAITPLARTFPAWVSILSGRHPHTTGAVINLFPRDLIHEGTTLPELLRENGYETFYGIDEVRFSNVDESYGFDHRISPPIGSTDFLIGHFADTPLSNLLVNSPAGRFLFPQVHGNRAIPATYDPDKFLEMLDRGIELRGPSFIAVHFTLTHHPYTWASGPRFLRGTAGIDKLVTAAYPSAVARADRQFGDLLALLERKGALENAVVIVLSDHGESLGDELPIRSVLDEPLTSYGHGTNVLASDQYDVLLGMRSYGSEPRAFAAGATVSAPASLEDIVPTVVDLLDLDTSETFDGQSLLPLLSDESSASATHRVRFIETEFNPNGFGLDEIAALSELENAAKAYRIDPETDRVLVREENVEAILASRQYAVLRDGHVLASLPVGDGETQTLLFAPAGSGFTWLAVAPDPAENPLAGELWGLLGDRFPALRDRPVVDMPW